VLALGYAGWAPGQLETEINQNGWLHCTADLELIFGQDTEHKYTKALRKIGIDLGMLSTEAGTASIVAGRVAVKPRSLLPAAPSPHSIEPHSINSVLKRGATSHASSGYERARMKRLGGIGINGDSRRVDKMDHRCGPSVCARDARNHRRRTGTRAGLFGGKTVRLVVDSARVADMTPMPACWRPICRGR